jgi:hypothetical protein
MAARRKRKKSKTKRISFKPGTSKRKKKRQARRVGPSLISILKVSAVVCVLAGIVIGLIFLERDSVPASEGTLVPKLAGVPDWVTDQLKEKVYVAARGDGNDLRLVQQNIAREVVWLDEVTVQTTHNALRIEGRWRRPVALVKSGLSRFYVDAEQVVLDFVQIPHLPIVKITGLPLITRTPPLGEVWQRDGLAAAIEIIKRLEQMDKLVTPDKPLLYEIDRVDVSNFNGKENAKHPHIVMYAKDNTLIIWGAEVGKWQRYLESTDEQKLAKLYGYYKEYGTLSGGAKYINLRDPQDNIPLPIDKY